MEQGQQCADPLQSKEVLDSQHYRQSVTENKARQGRRNFNCSVLGNTVMVSGANEDVCSSTHKDSEQHKDIEVTESAVCDSLASQQTPPPRLSCDRQLYEGRGLSEESVSIIMKSWRRSTLTGQLSNMTTGVTEYGKAAKLFAAFTLLIKLGGGASQEAAKPRVVVKEIMAEKYGVTPVQVREKQRDIMKPSRNK
nr:uncharacterized protein LOC117680757 [Crassostrea gigas]